MNLVESSHTILNQLSEMIHQIEENDYKKPIELLNNSTIGQHVRHTLEFFICLKNGLDEGVVNYDKRDHDTVIESDKDLSLTVINDIQQFLISCPKEKSLTLSANYSLNEEQPNQIATNIERELAYNIEHAIHHMAIIKIGLLAVAPYVKIPTHFGVAVSTIKYRNQVSGSNS